ncbi:MAG: M1 family metallopeptidase [Thermoanaerobaculia bacterium]
MESRRRIGGRSLRSAALVALCALPLQAASPARPPVVEYTIETSLEPATKILDGKERLVWRNPSNDRVGELRFHMYLNAFKNTRSTFMRESGGQIRGDERSRKPADWGWIDVLSMKISTGQDLRPGARFIQPDGNDRDDETVLAVPLPSPVPPRGEITLDIAFHAKLPRIFARTGFVRDYFLVGQWYPKVGVYEPAGMRGREAGGWNCHAFHAYSEFYADFGDFDVSIDVPSRFLIGATGKRIAERKTGDRTISRYVQRDVHDFAWTADPRFLVTEFTFDPARDVPAGWAAKAAEELGMSESELALKPISVRLLLQPGHERGRARYLRSIKEGISFYGLWFGAYPYETLTVVDPPEDGMSSAGMEYPTFVTGGGANAFLTRWPLDGVRLIELVTIHEYGHQYWYGMVGSNEFEEPWLDEGVNDDSEHRAMTLAYGPRDTAEFPGGIGVDSISLAHSDYTLLDNLDPIRRCAWCFYSGNSYGVNSYPKVGLFMAQLKNDLGTRSFTRAQRAYFQAWSFRHPGTSDFFEVFQKVSGRDLTEYRRQLIEGTSRLDWKVASARTRRSPRDEGVFDRPSGRVTLEEDNQNQKETRTYDTLVVFGNGGEWAHGAKARLVFENGVVVDRRLPASARWVRYRVERYSSRLAYAVVDPDRENVWDWSYLNNSKVLGTGKGAAETYGRRAVVKYSGWTAYLTALWSQLLWALA